MWVYEEQRGVQVEGRPHHSQKRITHTHTRSLIHSYTHIHTPTPMHAQHDLESRVAQAAQYTARLEARVESLQNEIDMERIELRRLQVRERVDCFPLVGGSERGGRANE